MAPAAIAFIPIVLCWAWLAACAEDNILPGATAFPQSAHDPKYKIEFHPIDSSYVPESDKESVLMADKDGNKFMCFLPNPSQQAAANENNSSSVSLVSDTNFLRKTPEELLSILKDKCLLRHEGWWTYELCYKGKFRQVHFENSKKVVQEFVLGIFDSEATEVLHNSAQDISIQKDPLSQSAGQRYYTHIFTNGTVCDLTNKSRETEVRYICAEGEMLISSIKESPSCRYTVVVKTPMLCKHPSFQEERQPWLVVHCNAQKEQNKDGNEEEIIAGSHELMPLLISTDEIEEQTE